MPFTAHGKASHHPEIHVLMLKFSHKSCCCCLSLGFQISHAMLNANFAGKFKRRIFDINVYNLQSDAKMMCREKQHQVLWLEIEIQSKIFEIIENLNFSFILSLGNFGFEIPCPKTDLWGSHLSWMQDFLEPHNAILWHHECNYSKLVNT